jgi:diacylglycerol kinase family enzyme
MLPLRCRFASTPCTNRHPICCIVLKVKSVRVFLNPLAGDGRTDRQRLGELFAANGVDASFSQLTRSVDLKKLAETTPADVALVAAGGDGTVNSVASAVAGTGRPMGVLALGTLNHFARDLGLPLTLEDAVRVIATGQIRRVDVGELNGHVFVNNSSLGIYPRMVVQRERLKQNGRNKWASLVVASLRAFISFKCIQVEIEVAGQQRTCTSPFVFIGNNPYCLDGLSVGERKRLDLGTLALYLAPGATRRDILRLAMKAALGKIQTDPLYEELTAKTFSANTHGRRRLRVALDGEVLRLHGPLVYRSLPGALHVLCPASPGVPA